MWLNKLIPAVLLTAVLSACSSVKTASDSGTETAKPVQEQGKKSSALSAAERAYAEAYRESDTAKRNERFKAVRKALETEAAEKNNLKAHLLLAYMADLGQGMPRDGIIAARHYRIAADGGLPEAKAALAEFWLRGEMFLPEAAQQIMSIPDYEKNPSLLCTLGAIYYAQFENAKGFQTLKKAFDLAAEKPRLRSEILKIIHGAFDKYFKMGNNPAALVELRHEKELDPKNALIPYFIGVVELRLGKPEAAEKSFDESMCLNPCQPYVYRELAFLKARSGRAEEALDDMKVAYAISGRDALYQRSMLEICVLTGNLEQMFKLVDTMLKTNPEDHDLRYLRVLCFVNRKEYRKAMDDLQILVRKDPKRKESEPYMDVYASVSAALGDYSEAVKIYEKMLSGGFQPAAALNLAELYIVADKYEAALRLLGQDGFKDSKDAMVRCVMPYLEAAALLAEGKNAEEQIGRFRAALPAFLEYSRKTGDVWQVDMFQNWLNKMSLPESARKVIQEMTDQIAGKQPLPEKSGK